MMIMGTSSYNHFDIASTATTTRTTCVYYHDLHCKSLPTITTSDHEHDHDRHAITAMTYDYSHDLAYDLHTITTMTSDYDLRLRPRTTCDDDTYLQLGRYMLVPIGSERSQPIQRC